MLRRARYALCSLRSRHGLANLYIEYLLETNPVTGIGFGIRGKTGAPGSEKQVAVGRLQGMVRDRGLFDRSLPELIGDPALDLMLEKGFQEAGERAASWCARS